MWRAIPIPILLGVLTLLLRAEAQSPRDERQIWIWKPLATFLVILVAGLSFTRPSEATDGVFSGLIIVALFSSMAGDVLLIPQDNSRAFLAGLVAFLCAHLVYISAFIYLQSSLQVDAKLVGEVAIAALLALVGWAVYVYLRPALDRLRIPVVGYILVISIMVHRAAALALVHPGPTRQPLLILVGALLFYLSDAILAVNKFRWAGRFPRYKLWNLSTYYGGQLLLALSSWFVG